MVANLSCPSCSMPIEQLYIYFYIYFFFSLNIYGFCSVVVVVIFIFYWFDGCYRLGFLVYDCFDHLGVQVLLRCWDGCWIEESNLGFWFNLWFFMSIGFEALYGYQIWLFIWYYLKQRYIIYSLLGTENLCLTLCKWTMIYRIYNRHIALSFFYKLYFEMFHKCIGFVFTSYWMGKGQTDGRGANNKEHVSNFLDIFFLLCWAYCSLWILILWPYKFLFIIYQETMPLFQWSIMNV